MTASGRTLDAILAAAPIVPFEARILACHVLGITRAQLITRGASQPTAEQARQIEALFQRRAAGEPIAYLSGAREFYGLDLQVAPGVLIPRPETELLVELALEKLPPQGRMLDLGTGSGAIAIAIAKARRDAQVLATDASAAALAIAQLNAERHAARVVFRHGKWYAPLAGERFDLIVSNPPYIAAGDPHLTQGDLRFEPIDALTDHDDGLSALRHIIHDASDHLLPGGWLLLEHGYDQAHAVRTLLQDAGLHQVESWRDLAGIERASGAML